MTDYVNKVSRPDTIPDQPFPIASEAGINQFSNDGVQFSHADEIPEIPFPQTVIASQVIAASLDTQSRQILGSFSFGTLGAVRIGQYANGLTGDISISPNGILARNASGVNTITIDGVTGDVTIVGTLAAGSVVTGYLTVGSAASDVNGGATTISGGMITTGSISANKLSVSTLSAITADLGTITAGSLSADRITAGTLDVARIPNLNASKITAGTIDASVISVTNINASNITTGSISAGKISGGTITSSDIDNTGGFIKTGKINIGASSSDPFYCYGTSINTSGHLNMGGHNIDNVDTLSGGSGSNSLSFKTNGDRVIIKDSSGNEKMSLVPNGSSSQLRMNGFNLQLSSNKTAIVKTSDGYRALYCIESPEVWFMDFFEIDKGIDPLFDEVTEGKSFFIACRDGDGKRYNQVWRHRKAHAEYRFEQKTEEEFIKNEQFLRMAKVN